MQRAVDAKTDQRRVGCVFSKVTLPVGDRGPHLIRDPLAYASLQCKCQFNQFIRFCGCDKFR